MSARHTARPAASSVPFSRPRPVARGGATCILLLAAGLCLAQSSERAAGESPIVPVHDEPHHRQVFQFGPMRILDLQIPPGDLSWFHTHEWPVLYMTLSQSAARMQNLGSDWSGGGGGARGGAARGEPPPQPAAPRATSTTGYIESPITHRIENVGDNLFRAMVVVNETQGDETRSVEEAGFEAEPELANAWFRSYRVTLEAGEATHTHAHATPVVIFQATGGNGLASGPMTFEFNEPGQWAFFDAGAEHTIRNLGDSSLQLLEIEVRRSD